MTNFATAPCNGRSVDVVIIGAGFAGLAAADQLTREGYSTLVLEGRDRIGGRVYSGEIAGVTIDLGATWVADRHEAVHELMDRFGIATTTQFHDGDNLLQMNGTLQKYLGTLPNGGPIDAEDLMRVQEKVEELVAQVDVAAIWSSPDAQELDSVSFGQWLDTHNAAPSTRALMEVVAKVQWGCGLGDVSLLHALRYQRAAGGLEHMLAVEGGQQQDRVTGGFQGIADRLAEQLSDRIYLSTPVIGIDQDETGVSVRTDKGVVRGQYVISTTPPAQRNDIEFDPALPERGKGLARTWRMGSLSKAFVAYDKPFWRDNGMSGVGISSSGAVFITFDVTADPSGPGVLVAFLDPRVYDRFNVKDRRQRVIEQLVELYGEQASNPLDYIDHCWGEEEFSPGGPNPAVAPYATTSYSQALAQPHGRIHWAGTETASEWAGTLNGALLSAKRAVEEVGLKLSSSAA